MIIFDYETLLLFCAKTQLFLIKSMKAPDNQHKRKNRSHCERFNLEAPPRFELGHKAFAELCLTTWLWCRL